MAAKFEQRVIVINEGFTERERTNLSTGAVKSRVTMTIDSQPILHDLNEEKLGEGPARAIAAAIRAGIKNITELAKGATLEKRKRAKEELARGVRSALQRYSGGRTGTKEPSGSVRLFNDSGRLADGLEVRQNTAEGNWTINVPANRLDPSTFKNRGDFVAMLTRLRELVPALRDPTSIPEVKRAIERGIRDLLIRELDRADELRTRIARQVFDLLSPF